MVIGTIPLYPSGSNRKSNPDYFPFDRKKNRHHYHAQSEQSASVCDEIIVRYMNLPARTQASQIIISNKPANK